MKKVKVVAVTDNPSDRFGKHFPWTAHRVTDASAARILTVLNETRFRLDDPAQAWVLLEMDEQRLKDSTASYQRFTIRNGYLYETL